MSKVYFDLKAFRKGILAKKTSLIAAERRAIDRVYAQPAPEGWTIETFLTRAKIAPLDSCKSTASLFTDWKDFISSSRQDLFRVSNVLNSGQVKKLAHHLELFNRGLWPPKDAIFPVISPAPAWTDEEVETLHALVSKYGGANPWLFVSAEMKRTVDDVKEKFLATTKQKSKFEICLSKSFRPLLMNRQFRLVPPQLVIIPSTYRSESPYETPLAFRKYL